MKTYDVCVIGAGFTGLATAYELCKEGQKVALVDAGGLGSGASAANTSMLLFENTDDEGIFTICLDGVRAFETLHEELGQEIGFGTLDFINFFTRPGERQAAEETRARYRKGGFSHYDILSAEEVFHRQPLLQREGVLGGACCRQWRVDPMRATLAWFARARDMGMDWYPQSPVTGFEREGERITGAVTPQGVIRAGRFLVAAGAWSRELLQTAGIQLPQYYIHGAAMVLERTPAPLMDSACMPFTSERVRMEREASRLIEALGWENMPRQESREFVVVPDSNGNLIAAQRSYAAPEMTRRVPAGYLHDMCAALHRWYPAFDGLRVVRSWISPVPFVPDGQGFFGFLAPYRNLAVSSGYGSVLIMAPVLGKMGAALLTDSPHCRDVPLWNPNRFERRVTAP